MRIYRFAGIIAILCIFIIRIPVRAEEAPPEKAYIQGVPGHAQSFFLSCESRSAADYAAFWGVRIRERKFLSELPRSDNPDKGFVGKPDDPWGNVPPKSYGVHAAPVAELLANYGLQVEMRRNMEWRRLQVEIAAGRPVIVWVIGQMWPGKAITYEASNGKKVTVAAYEHTMILIGYNKNVVYAVDAYTGETRSYNKNAFLKSWSTLGKMAIIGSGKKQENAKPTETSQDGNTFMYLPLVTRKEQPQVQPVPKYPRIFRKR